MANSTFKVPAHPAGDAEPSRLMPKSTFTTEGTEEFSHRFYVSDDGSVAAGVWECDPCRMEIESYPVDEQMTIISGRLLVTNADGVEESFGPGEVLFVSKGSKLTWHITERLKKYFMTSH